MKLVIEDRFVNEPQRESMERMLAEAKQAHEVNIHVRINGQDHYFEADYLSHADVEAIDG